MSDKHFSVDDILDDFSGGSNLDADFDLDEFIRGDSSKKSSVNIDMSTFKIEETKVITSVEEMSKEMQERRLDLINREIISGDYEHEYLGESFKDVIEQENQIRAANNTDITAILPDINLKEKIEKSMEQKTDKTDKINKAENIENKEHVLTKKEQKKLEKERKQLEKSQKKQLLAQQKSRFDDEVDIFDKLAMKSDDDYVEHKVDEEAFNQAMNVIGRSKDAGRSFSDKIEDAEEEEFSPLYDGPKNYTGNDVLVFTGDNKKGKFDDTSILDEYTGDVVSRILNQYDDIGSSSSSGSFPSTAENVGAQKILSGVTGVIDRVMKTDNSDNNGGETSRSVVSSNTDLIEGMRKVKRERLMRTSHISPVERASISDVKFNLDDKMIENTANLEVSDDEISEEEKLRKRREDKVADFVYNNEDDEDEDEIEDYENMDDAISVVNDIVSLKKTMVRRLFILLICLVFSLYFTIVNETGGQLFDLMNMRNQPSTYLFVNTIIGLVAAFAAYNVISNGIMKLVQFKAESDTIAAVTMVSTLALSMISITNTNLVRGGVVHEYIPLGIATLVFNTIGKILILSRTQKNFKFVSGDAEHYGIYQITDTDTAEKFTRGALNDFPILTTMRKTETITGFVNNSYSIDSADNFSKMFIPIILIASLLVGVIGAATGVSQYGMSSIFVGLSCFTGCLAACSCFSLMLVVNLPMYMAARKNSEIQGALISSNCFDDYSETNSVMVDSSLLFPRGSVTLSKMKIFSDARIDEVIIEAASLAYHSGSVMKNLFYDMIVGKTEILNPVESYIYEDSMGLSGWINNKRVLLGSRELMMNHSIDGLPPIEKERKFTDNHKFAVYLSISGELSAMFIVNVTPVPEVIDALRELEKERIKLLIRTVDSFVSVENLSVLFDISPDTVKVLTFRVHKDFEEATSYTQNMKTALTCCGRFATFVSLITGTKRIRGTVSVGIAIQALSILVGILLSVLMVVLRQYEDMSVLSILLYNLIFTAILLIFNAIKKV